MKKLLIVLIAFFLSALFISCEEESNEIDEETKKQEALANADLLHISFESPSGNIRPSETISFKLLNESYPEEEMSQYLMDYKWNFGDGETSLEENPTHTYSEVGIYPVSLEVTITSTLEKVTLFEELTIGQEQIFIELIQFPDDDFAPPGTEFEIILMTSYFDDKPTPNVPINMYLTGDDGLESKNKGTLTIESGFTAEDGKFRFTWTLGSGLERSEVLEINIDENYYADKGIYLSPNNARIEIRPDFYFSTDVVNNEQAYYSTSHAYQNDYGHYSDLNSIKWIEYESEGFYNLGISFSCESPYRGFDFEFEKQSLSCGGIYQLEEGLYSFNLNDVDFCTLNKRMGIYGGLQMPSESNPNDCFASSGSWEVIEGELNLIEVSDYYVKGEFNITQRYDEIINNEWVSQYLTLENGQFLLPIDVP